MMLLTITEFCQQLANCGTPTDQIDSSIVNIMGYRDPAIAGSNITISCTSGHVQNDTIIAICRENGKWEPDIKEIVSNCSGYQV